MCAATGAVRKKNTTVKKARRATPRSFMCRATARSMQPMPRVAALVAVCILVNRSGIRTTPMAAASRKTAPMINNAAWVNSFIATFSFQIARKCHRAEKRDQRQHDRGIQKHGLTSRYGVDGQHRRYLHRD